MHPSIRWLFGTLAVLGTLTACSLPRPPGAPAEETPAPAVLATPLPSNTIIADAMVVPERSVDLTFKINGTVAEVLVKEGDTVAAGAPLARLDTFDLELEIAQRKANLAQAQAAYDKIAAGATPQEIAAQEALIRNASANLERTRTGTTTAADIANAQAQIRSAQARLDALKTPDSGQVSSAQLAVTQAQNALESTRTNASAAKTNAELALSQAAEALTRAQASYATAKENWNYVQATGQDPTNPELTDPATGKQRKNKLNDVQERQYYEAFVQAEAALRSAEHSVTQAQVSYEQARQEEIVQLQQAEAVLGNAQRQLEVLLSPNANAIIQAQASVDQARANLQKLRQGGLASDVAAAQANVDQAQAQLEKLTASPRVVDLAEAQGKIEAAKVALQQAERNRDQATLRAPFAGTIAERNLEVGQQMNATAGATSEVPFVLADFQQWRIETDNLSERDVVRFDVGAPATITFDALPDLSLAGTVQAIQPFGIDRFGDMTYTVTVVPSAWDARLRWNMSAATIIEASR
jgi:HlyD family secretion protein